ncbi:MAG: response regulator [Candidatus Sericytochromatia bacterium]
MLSSSASSWPLYQQALLIDDDPISLLVCEKLLTSSGVVAYAMPFRSPREALCWLQNHPLTERVLLLLDLYLPELNAVELLAQLPSQSAGHLDIYVMSSSPQAPDIAPALAHPQVRGFLNKPLSLRQLVRLELNPSKHS